MSETYFPNHGDTNGTQAGGHPWMSQQPPSYQPPMPGQPTPSNYPSIGDARASSYGPVQPHPPTDIPLAQLPRRILATLVVAVLLVLALGGFAFVTHGKLGDAETKVEGLTQSLDKANKSVASKQSELKSNQEELKTAQQQNEQMGAALKVTLSCATQLEQAWNLLMNSASNDQIIAAYNASREPCDQLAGAQSAE
jgi:hypothetical protein